MAGFQYACMAKYNPMTVPAMKTKNAMRTRLTNSMIALGARASRPQNAQRSHMSNDNTARSSIRPLVTLRRSKNFENV
ncbi:MAG: hypothetical protein QOE82_981 [Thermoanaerobaculia bacterium]|nr:hypothetical protein [Thermoanaerobaculia bacterium]